MLKSSNSCISQFIFLKATLRVLRRLLAEIERRTDPVTIQINQSNSLHSVISRTSAGSNSVAQTWYIV
ncbi:hypothetical protein V1478_002404 [Vespula squamosa]|uniref:Uncharacterized protein n=1 Tax=Vespula squamosa TaxID=30214 RepID=A0ABD2BVT3_VESSQ